MKRKKILKFVLMILLFFGANFFVSLVLAKNVRAADCGWVKAHLPVTNTSCAALSQTRVNLDETREGCKNDQTVITIPAGQEQSYMKACCCSEIKLEIKEEEKKPLFIMPELQIKIPGLDLTPSSSIDYQTISEGSYKVSIPWLAEYIVGIYNYGLSIAGILAAIILMAGGLMWLISAGNDSKISKAKEFIAGGLGGLALLMFSYFMLFAVNPELTVLKPIEIGTIKPLVFDEPSEAVLTGQTRGMECFFNTFGNTSDEVEKQLVYVTMLNKKIRVHKKAQAAFEAVAQEIKNSGYAPESIGTWNWRANVNNPSSMSLHSFGIALDFDPAKNDNYKKKCSSDGWCKYTINGNLNHKCSGGDTCLPSPCMTNIPISVQKAFKDNGFRWGGDYKSICDAMHFEWIEPCLK